MKENTQEAIGAIIGDGEIPSNNILPQERVIKTNHNNDLIFCATILEKIKNNTTTRWQDLQIIQTYDLSMSPTN